MTQRSGRAKRAAANRRSAAGDEGRPQQGEVWDAVSERLDLHAVASPSHAFTDLFEQRRPALKQFTEPIEALDGQLGAVVQIGAEPVALDLVSRPSVFVDLLPRLSAG